jgi:glycerol uptake facilitator protein
MQAFVAELVGTMVLVIFGDGVVANVVLRRTKGNQGGWIVITTGWGLAVALAIYCVGRISGAHLNPAVSIGLASIGEFEWSQVGPYVAAQMTGAILGAIVVWLAYWPHFAVTEDPGAKLAVFCTGPETRSPGANFLTELIGTAMLVFGVLAIAANADEMVGEPGGVDLSAVFSTGLNPLLVGFLVWGIGLSLGGPPATPSIPPATSVRASPTPSSRFPARAARIGATRGCRSWDRSPAESSARWRSAPWGSRAASLAARRPLARRPDP